MIEEFSKEKLVDSGVIVVKGYADWCMPCKMYKPTFEKVAERYKDKASFYEIDLGNNQEFAQEYEVRGIPTTLFFKDGVYYMLRVGVYTEEQLEAFIDMVIKGE